MDNNIFLEREIKSESKGVKRCQERTYLIYLKRKNGVRKRQKKRKRGERDGERGESEGERNKNKGVEREKESKEKERRESEEQRTQKFGHPRFSSIVLSRTGSSSIHFMLVMVI